LSRAFVKESEDDPDVPIPETVLPPGVANVITRAGAARLRAERADLAATRKQLEGRTEDAVAVRRIARRIAWLDRRIPTFVEVDPPRSADRVVFGTTVTVAGDEPRVFRIVGVDEIEPERGDVSWMSPIGAALIGARVGDTVTLKLPGGAEDVDVLAIRVT
jgi:transcription elongation factor GreB